MTDAPNSPPRPATPTPPAPHRRRVWWWVGGGVLVVLAVVAALVFQPWLLFIDVRVDDEIPAAAASSTPDASEPVAPARGRADGHAPHRKRRLRPRARSTSPRGTLISHEHETSGTVRVIQLPDGSRQLAIENLETTNGPDVHVWLSAGPAVEGFDGWFTAGGHPYVDLGMIKGNQGNQLYDIPADVDLAAYPTVDLWCVQFAVSFGAAALTPS